MDSIKKWLKYWYFRYELLTNIYVFEPWEKAMLNTLILGTTSLVVYSSWVYLPAYTRSMLAKLAPCADTVKEPSEHLL